MKKPPADQNYLNQNLIIHQKITIKMMFYHQPTHSLFFVFLVVGGKGKREGEGGMLGGVKGKRGGDRILRIYCSQKRQPDREKKKKEKKEKKKN